MTSKPPGWWPTSARFFKAKSLILTNHPRVEKNGIQAELKTTGWYSKPPVSGVRMKPRAISKFKTTSMVDYSTYRLLTNHLLGGEQ
jgi:hypothetical protein